MDSYDGIRFKKGDGYDMTTCPVRNTKTIKEEYGSVKEGYYEDRNFAILASDYFCPFNNLTGEMNITKRTIGIHWFAATWRSPITNLREKVLRPLKKIIGVDKFASIKAFVLKKGRKK